MSKTAAAYKLKTMRAALAQDIVPHVRLRGMPTSQAVRSVTNHGHSLTLTLDRGAGFLIVDPTDVMAVWLPRLPEKPQPEDESQFESNVDDD
jgi:hypothetical protein